MKIQPDTCRMSSLVRLALQQFVKVSRLVVVLMVGLVIPINTSLGIEPPVGTQIVHPRDKTIMVYVPSGQFVMGLAGTEAEVLAGHLGFAEGDDLWAWEAYPQRSVYVDGFFIDKYEITVHTWHHYVKVTGNESEANWSSRHYDDPAGQLFPAASIRWAEARRYAAWAGKALPTEAQWEKAARGTDGRLYPWGNSAPTAEVGHFGRRGEARPKGYELVGTFPGGASPCGALDMLGNQYEWPCRWLEPYPGNPQAEKMEAYAGQVGCLRGGSFYHGWVSFYAAKRFGLSPRETHYHIGLRTVWVPPEGYFASDQFSRDQSEVAGQELKLQKMRQAAGSARNRQQMKGLRE